MRKMIGAFLTLLLGTVPYAQIVYEKNIYSSADDGDIELEDMIISEENNPTDLVATGHYFENQDSSNASYWAVLTSSDSSSTGVFNKRYQDVDTANNPFNTLAYDVEEFDGGYILVGSVQSNSYYGTTVIGGADIFILKVNSAGNVLTSKRVDFGSFEEGYAIHPTDTSRTEFVICGYSNISNNRRNSVVLEIDLSLNINWVQELDLRLTSSAPERSTLHDVTVDDDYVWSVGSITTTSTTATDGLVVQLDLSGNFIGAYNFTKTGSTSDEVFYGVENDGSHLAIGGSYKRNALNDMGAWRYVKSTNTMSIFKRLRVPITSGFEDAEGYDIKPYNLGGSMNGYFLVGESISNSGISRGVLYELDNSYNPIRRARMTNGGDVVLNSLDVYEGATPYLGIAGLNTASLSAFSDGYFLKTDMNGYTGCNDTLSPSYSSPTYLSDTLWVDSVKIYIDSTFNVEVDTLLDSLICYDTLSVPTVKNVLQSDQGSINTTLDGIKLYPNPIRVGEELHINFAETKVLQGLIVMDMSGRVIYRLPHSTSVFGDYHIPIDSLISNGTYIVQLKLDDGDSVHLEQFKLLVE